MTEEQREMYESIVNGPRAGTPGLVDSEGRLGGPLNTYLHAPGIGGRQAAFGASLTFQVSLPRRLAEIVILTVANDVHSEFQLASHEWFGYEAGLTHDQLEALRERREPELEDPAERAAWQTTVRLLERGDLDDSEYESAVAALGERGLVEVVTLVGYYRLVALQLRVFRIQGDAYAGSRVPERT
jgi:4-carboxymuconolactone decarboxylase